MAEDKREKFSDFLLLNNILCPVEIISSDELLKRLLAVLQRHYPELDIDKAGEEVRAREAIYSTVVAPGLAVPHARIAGLTEPLIALACSPNGLLGGEVQKGIRLTVLLLTPLENPNLHLQLLSTLAADFANEEFLNRVAQAPAPQEVLHLLKHDANQKSIPDYLLASDLMITPPAVLQETDSVARAIRTFSTTGWEELPVLDSAGDLRGVLSLTDLLRYSLPEHLLWLENLSPIYHFQPFSEMLKTAEENKVADLMREEYLFAESDIPAVQIAKLFLMNNVPQMLITRQGKFAGIVKLKDFCSRLFWE